VKCLCLGSAVHPDLPGFPTRRSSDLTFGGRRRKMQNGERRGSQAIERADTIEIADDRHDAAGAELRNFVSAADQAVQSRAVFKRSEEHTSELQSRSDLVCRPLLENKK